MTTQALINTSKAVSPKRHCYISLTKPFPDPLDQLNAFIGEISKVAVFLLSSFFFLLMSQSLYETMKSIAVWTVMSAIGTNGVLSVIKSVVGVIEEYRKHTGKSVRGSVFMESSVVMVEE